MRETSLNRGRGEGDQRSPVRVVIPLAPEAAMNLNPLHQVATEMTSLVSGAAGILPDLSADDGTGLLMPALTGVVAAVTVALALAIYFQTGYRSYRDMIP